MSERKQHEIHVCTACVEHMHETDRLLYQVDTQHPPAEIKTQDHPIFRVRLNLAPKGGGREDVILLLDTQQARHLIRALAAEVGRYSEELEPVSKEIAEKAIVWTGKREGDPPSRSGIYLGKYFIKPKSHRGFNIHVFDAGGSYWSVASNYLDKTLHAQHAGVALKLTFAGVVKNDDRTMMRSYDIERLSDLS